MHPHNAFSLNLSALKSQAKQRLKAIRQGSTEALQTVQSHHPKPHQLSAETIRLADVQFVIARELGLPSWSQLKQHVDSLSEHRRLMEQGSNPLDNDMPTLHLRCGHDIQHRLREAGFAGDFLPFIAPYCIGPLTSSTDFEMRRADFIRHTLLSETGECPAAEQLVKETQSKLSQIRSERYQRLVFWVEHDNYDQLMLIRLLAFLADVPTSTQRRIELIEVDCFPGHDRFIGLGQLPAEGLRSLWQQRQNISQSKLCQARLIWQAFCAPTPQPLVALLHATELAGFPNLRNVIIRHLQELPHCNSGLSLTQTLALKVLQQADQPLAFSDLFSAYQSVEPLPFLGDLMFWALIKSLTLGTAPLMTVTSRGEPKGWFNQELVITAHGRRCLAQQVRAECPVYWVGGIVSRPEQYWTWDHLSLSTLHFMDAR
ncbi:DUF1835 domain-containing protein [Photobacterium galatheae]|uniref:DUF1835 domain-containing protein n=1 Tax=Photobacterium galatheae TaxID=1654360 RepID=A0A066RNV9_9GAMM|nr:DUF1835 domain-containing protein [Photobacterium galatheae]KDM92044.1 hypothetical protein EA58_08500 [Photobacterium galatheae]MCM0151041.1 DUF1835 domain-containing protein [Photobacterium galatheae]